MIPTILLNGFRMALFGTTRLREWGWSARRDHRSWQKKRAIDLELSTLGCAEEVFMQKAIIGLSVLAHSVLACGDSGTGGTSGTSVTTTSAQASSSSASGTSTTTANGSGASTAATKATSASSSSGGTQMNFFVTSDTKPNGDFGGLEEADKRCQMLAEAVGEGAKTWRAYLSTETPMVHARDRIGAGPYVNARGAMLAADKDALHAINGSADLFVNEKGEKINGQWENSPDPNEHDIFTGTEADGTVQAGATCEDWTAASGSGRVGHSDGLGPGGSPNPPNASWNSSHNAQCGNPTASGGSAKIYCFVGP